MKESNYPYLTVSFSCKYCNVTAPNTKRCEHCGELVHFKCMARHIKEVHPDRVNPPGLYIVTSCLSCPNVDLYRTDFGGCETVYKCKKYAERKVQPNTVCNDHPEVEVTEAIINRKGTALEIHEMTRTAPSWNIAGVEITFYQYKAFGLPKLEENTEYVIKVEKIIKEKKKSE